MAVLFLLLYTALPLCFTCPMPQVLPQRAVTDRNGVLLSLAPEADHYRRQPLPAGEPLPAPLVKALLAAEDHRFFLHGGVDPLAMGRALWDKLTGGPRSGGSTITMQLAKMLCGNKDRTLRTKFQEIMLARQLELRLPKESILRAYLDRADYGNLCCGAEAASYFYFGKPAAQLRTEEAALLTALVQAPGRLNPLRHPEAALRRRNLILTRMGEQELTRTPLAAQAHTLSLGSALRTRPGKLTLDAALQKDCQRIAAEEVTKQLRHNMTQAAVVVLDNRSGEVLVSVGAALPYSERGGQLDGTATPRSAGSTLKPFVYLQAFGHGAWPGTVLADVPTLYRSSDGVQAPTDYNGHYRGPITIRQALGCSQNVPAMEALNNYGGIPALMQLLNAAGMHLTEDVGHYGLGLAIGNAHVTLVQLTRAYAALARGGSLPPVYTRLPHPQEEGTPLFNPAHCYLIADILSDPHARAAAFGAAPNMRFPFRVACKTGTSSDFRDNWCVGFTAEYTVGVWAGNFDNTSMHHISGVSGAGPIFHRVFTRLYDREDCPPATFPTRPAEIEEVIIDTRTGTLADDRTPQECRRKELGVRGQIPTAPGHYDEQGRAVLDARYEDWYATCGMQHLYALNTTLDTGRAFAVLIPADNTVLELDNSLPNGGSVIELKSTLPPAHEEWSCTTLPLSCRQGRWYATLRPGTHTLRVYDRRTGNSTTSTFFVEKR